MVRWTGFADFGFAGSARLAFDRALERAETDAHEVAPDAWVLEDRRVAFHFDGDSSIAVLEGVKRLLEALSLEAHAGEAVIECKDPQECWSRRAAVSISKEIAIEQTGEGPAIDEEYDGPSETIRTGAS